MNVTLADMLIQTYLNKVINVWFVGSTSAPGGQIVGGGTLTFVGSDYITVKDTGDLLHTYPMSAILQIYP